MLAQKTAFMESIQSFHVFKEDVVKNYKLQVFLGWSKIWSH